MLFETDKDKENEVEYIKKIEKRFLCESAKLPITAGADYFLVRNRRLVCVAEIKCRTCKKDDYETTIIGKEKLRRARKFTLYFGHYDTGKAIPLILFFRFVDQDSYFVLDHEIPLTTFREEVITRADRKESKYAEASHLHIPVSQLLEFK